MTMQWEFPDRGLWILSAILIAGSLPGMETGTELLSGGPPSLLAGPTWIAPLARVFDTNALREWWAPLFVMSGSWIVAILSQRFTFNESWERLALVVGLSFLIRPSDLLCAAVLVLLTDHSGARSPSVRHRQLLIAAAVSLLVTLEFGIVLGLVLAELLSDLLRPPAKRAWLPLVVLVIAIAGGVWFAQGFGPAMVRPISRFWLQPPGDVFPSLRSIWHAPDLWFPVGLIVGTIASTTSRDGQHFRSVWFVLLAWLAVSCQRYTGLWLMVLLLKHIDRDYVGHALPNAHRIKLACGVLAAGWAIWTTDLASVLTGPAVAQRIDPAQWESRGTVMLMNLDRSADWKRPEIAPRFPLLADDRWDALSNQLDLYAALSRDLSEVRDHRYWRVDGQWGGYAPALKQWSPSLLVVETSDLASIRGLSLSPDWRVMGIDGQQTLFGRVSDPRNAQQMRHAINSLLTLEWPGRLEQLSLENTIVTKDTADDRAVAKALCALRFPYAALRFARQESRTSPLRAQCLLELAHRVGSHSSAGSLLDQYRAIVVARDALNTMPAQSVEAIFLQRGLKVLLNRTNALTEAVTDETEQPLRRALLAGETSAVTAGLQQLSSPRRAFYQILHDAPERTADEIVTAFKQALPQMESEVPAETLAEAQFYLGCAALEAGQIDTAVPAFAASVRLDADSPFREIRQMYLQQIGR